MNLSGIIFQYFYIKMLPLNFLLEVNKLHTDQCSNCDSHWFLHVLWQKTHMTASHKKHMNQQDSKCHHIWMYSADLYVAMNMQWTCEEKDNEKVLNVKYPQSNNVLLTQMCC